ncbi:SNF2-family ATP dependent chromatin remodeling factor snf21 [Coprinopsis sp. MPI-PUGE-AT-0042]|nr:SNF2-family ATP dependent chromatin remodeling factor snf21 [Coprinopsis sp. MPI-PUGE-AT-0042]
MSSSAPSPSPFPFDDESRIVSRAASTSASSPPAHPLSEHCSPSASVVEVEDEPETKETDDLEDFFAGSNVDADMKEKLSKLKGVLDKSKVYSQILCDRLEEDKKRQREAFEAQQRKAKAGSKRGRTSDTGKGKRKVQKGAAGEAVPVDEDKEEDEDALAEKFGVFQQPKLITGAKLKSYQLEGLQWMVSMDQNGISGILADEMGLGKTLQTIAFSAYLRERQNSRPFLVVCPLSVLHNWVSEYQKFAPQIPVCMYYGTREERAELRATVLSRSEENTSAKEKAKQKAGRPKKSKAGKRKRRGADSDEDEGEDSASKEDSEKFPVVVTTYDIIMRDRAYLEKYQWGYIVVDEGHRLKNLNCKLMTEIKKYPSAGRMILTGTPLHNNLAELWSLLNFILPDIFDDIDVFQEWFNLPTLQQALPGSQSQEIITSLHAILKPFLLRRLKVDVEMNLPPKKEYVLYAPLSVRQREAYDRVLDGTLRSWLISGGTAGKHGVSALAPSDDDSEEEEVPLSGLRVSRRTKGTKNYDVDGDDDDYFEKLENGEIDQRGREFQVRQKVTQVNNMHLQNKVMQLRKVCSHPFLFDWPIDPVTKDAIIGEELVNASGKMMVLDRLLRELFRRDHKVLIFSQFTTMLDIIEDWAVETMGWIICRIDGKSNPFQRKAEMERFQTGGNDPKAPRLFLLSTRAGGLGINLVAADTVIFYDQDWNPQMDAQAQDRAHRIGQTRPVLIFRLMSAHTIETTIMQRAGEKKKLEALVIAKGQPGAAAAASRKKDTFADLAAELLKLEGEKIEVVPDTSEGKAKIISDEDLDALLDRSPEVFSDRPQRLDIHH